MRSTPDDLQCRIDDCGRASAWQHPQSICAAHQLARCAQTTHANTSYLQQCACDCGEERQVNLLPWACPKPTIFLVWLARRPLEIVPSRLSSTRASSGILLRTKWPPSGAQMYVHVVPVTRIATQCTTRKIESDYSMDCRRPFRSFNERRCVLCQ